MVTEKRVVALRQTALIWSPDHAASTLLWRCWGDNWRLPLPLKERRLVSTQRAGADTRGAPGKPPSAWGALPSAPLVETRSERRRLRDWLRAAGGRAEQSSCAAEWGQTHKRSSRNSLEQQAHAKPSAEAPREGRDRSFWGNRCQNRCPASVPQPRASAGSVAEEHIGSQRRLSRAKGFARCHT